MNNKVQVRGYKESDAKVLAAIYVTIQHNFFKKILDKGFRQIFHFLGSWLKSFIFGHLKLAQWCMAIHNAIILTCC